MERQIVGILVEADYHGKLEVIVEYFSIAKETPKMVYPDRSGRKRDSAIRYLSQMRKAELGQVERRNTYKDGFSFQTHNIFSDEKEVERAKDKLIAMAEQELNERVELLNSWIDQYERKVKSITN